jgi:cytosine deaminase
VTELLAAGVNVAAGQDCIRDPFYPLGTGQMLDVAHMLVHADHLSLPHQIDFALEAVTVRAAAAMRLPDYGIVPGCQADLVVLPVAGAHEAIRLRPMPTHVVKRGRLISPDK